MLYLGILRALLAAPAEYHRAGTYHGREREKHEYRSYSNKRRDAYKIFGATNAALIRGRRLIIFWS